MSSALCFGNTSCSTVWLSEVYVVKKRKSQIILFHFHDLCKLIRWGISEQGSVRIWNSRQVRTFPRITHAHLEFNFPGHWALSLSQLCPVHRRHLINICWTNECVKPGSYVLIEHIHLTVFRMELVYWTVSSSWICIYLQLLPTPMSSWLFFPGSL